MRSSPVFLELSTVKRATDLFARYLGTDDLLQLAQKDISRRARPFLSQPRRWSAGVVRGLVGADGVRERVPPVLQRGGRAATIGISPTHPARPLLLRPLGEGCGGVPGPTACAPPRCSASAVRRVLGGCDFPVPAARREKQVVVVAVAGRVWREG